MRDEGRERDREERRNRRNKGRKRIGGKRHGLKGLKERIKQIYTVN